MAANAVIIPHKFGDLYMVCAKKFTLLLVTLLIVMLLTAHLHAGAAPPLRDINARSALLIEVDTGHVLFPHNVNNPHPADALARVMTLLLAVTAYDAGEIDLYDIVAMTDSAWEDISPWSTTLGILPGEEMSLIDLMHCAFLGGASEANNLIAEHIAGSVAAFVRMMNAHALELGAENTAFENTHGQYHPSQYTTAYDIFLIYRDALSYPLFVEISGTFRYSVESTNMSEPRRLIGSNSLLNTGGRYYFRYCTSGVASSLYEGGYSFFGFAESDGLSLIAIVLGSEAEALDDGSFLLKNLSESRRLFEWGFTNFAWRTILSTSDLVERAPVVHGAGADFVNLRPESSIKQLLSNEESDNEFIRNVTIYSEERGEELVAPISAGEVLGEVTVTRDGVDYGTVLLVANTSIELHRLEFIRMQISDIMASTAARAVMAVLFVIILSYMGLVVRYNVLRRRRLQEIAERKKILARQRQQGEQVTDFDDQDTITRKPNPKQ